jgi:hypothetical protein
MQRVDAASDYGMFARAELIPFFDCHDDSKRTAGRCAVSVRIGWSPAPGDSYLRRLHRRRYRLEAEKGGLLGVWLVAPLALLEERIAARSLDASDATVDVLRRSAKDDPGAGGWLQVDASDGRAVVEAIRRAISVEIVPAVIGFAGIGLSLRMQCTIK